MKNFVAEGRTFNVAASVYAAAGQGVLVGSIFGVTACEVNGSGTVDLVVEGVFTLDKATGVAWTVGALIYWDNLARNCTTTVGSNKLIGVAQSAALAADTVGTVRLNGAFIS